MKTLILSLCLFVVALSQTGCAMLGFAPVDDGASPVVVNAERTTAISFSAVDNFLKFDDENREYLRTKAPAVHAIAEQLRREAPQSFAAVRALTATYKTTRLPEDGDKVNQALQSIQELARLARQGLIDAQRSKFSTNILYQKARQPWLQLSRLSYPSLTTA